MKSEPAFPHVTGTYNVVSAGGMTLRDYFAAKALQGSVANDGYVPNKQYLAQWCYEMADAMMQARGEK